MHRIVYHFLEYSSNVDRSVHYSLEYSSHMMDRTVHTSSGVLILCRPYDLSIFWNIVLSPIRTLSPKPEPISLHVMQPQNLIPGAYIQTQNLVQNPKLTPYQPKSRSQWGATPSRPPLHFFGTGGATDDADDDLIAK